MKNIVSIIVALLVGVAGGYVIRGQIGGALPSAAPSPNRQANNAAPAAPGADQIFKVVVGEAPTKGPADARVTIVEFSDFQCPFCSRVVPTVKQIEETYGKDVRVVFKNNPLPMHQDAPNAAKAAVAAWKQNKFWEMHDAMFAAQKVPDGLKPIGLEKIAKDIGLDVEKFKADMANVDTQQLIESDKTQARQLGATGTPSFFINGVKVSGALPFDSFKTIIDAAMKRADAKIAAGTPKAQVYDALIRDGLTQAPAPKDQPQRPSEPQAKKIELDETAPVKGGKSPKVTIVMWSDFQCPFCGRAEPTIKQIMDTYKDDVRVEWKNQPLPFHPNAMPAAKAAMAAHKQGKFWAMHDLMFQDQKDLSDAKYEEWAKQAGLDVSRWKKDKESPEIEAAIKKDMAQGAAVGANGTPAFFINGKFVSGAQPFDAFKTVIDDQIAKANAELKKGTPASKLYDVLVAANVAAAGTAAAAAPAPDAIVKVDVGNSPARGGKNAAVTVVEWSDFQCPYCSRVEPTINQLRAEYGDKVKWVWKNQPLPFHPNAMPAAEAAMAAGDQGKFWEMHDKLFENQAKLGPDLYDQLAKELGLDLNKFHDSISSGKNKAAIQADMSAGSAAGAGGTPTFFVNGHKLVGAQPPDAFKQVIDAELSHAIAKK